MNKKNIIKFLFFLILSFFLLYLILKGQNIEELKSIMKEDVHYKWIGFACIAGTLSHISRALRWQILTSSMGHQIRFGNSLMGVLIGYFANIAIPRMGEVTRCVVVSKYEKVPISKLLGNIVAERILDLLILLSLTFIVVITQFKQIGIFLANNPSINEKLMAFQNSKWLLISAIIIFIVSIFVWEKLIKHHIKGKISNFISGIREGILSIRKVNNLPLFIFHSLFIWAMFYLSFYFAFFSFDFTSSVDALTILSIFVIGSYGMVAPVQGGIGAWHFMIIAALYVYLPNVENLEILSKAFALMTHGSMMLLYVVLGAVSLIILPIYNARRNNQ